MYFEQFAPIIRKVSFVSYQDTRLYNTSHKKSEFMFCCPTDMTPPVPGRVHPRPSLVPTPNPVVFPDSQRDSDQYVWDIDLPFSVTITKLCKVQLSDNVKVLYLLIFCMPLMFHLQAYISSYSPSIKRTIKRSYIFWYIHRCLSHAFMIKNHLPYSRAVIIVILGFNLEMCITEMCITKMCITLSQNSLLGMSAWRANSFDTASLAYWYYIYKVNA